jgi:hypothetical protein
MQKVRCRPLPRVDLFYLRILWSGYFLICRFVVVHGLFDRILPRIVRVCTVRDLRQGQIDGIDGIDDFNSV